MIKLRETLNQLSQRHQAFMKHPASTQDQAYIESGKLLLQEIRAQGRYLDDPILRDEFSQLARDVNQRLLELTDEYFPARLEFFGEEDTNQLAVGNIHPDMLTIMPLEARLPPPSYLHLVGVEESLSRLMDVIVSPEPPWLISIEGIGGIGKTTLADVLARRFIKEDTFYDLGWISARQTVFNMGGGIKPINKPALSSHALIKALVEQLLGIPPMPLSTYEAFSMLQNRLKEQPHLIVIDNLEKVLDVEALLPTLRRLVGPSKILLTYRKSLYTEPDIYRFVVPELSESNALQLIRLEARMRNLPHLEEASDEELRPIYNTVGGNPLALRLLVGQTHIHSLDVILRNLTTAHGETVENLYTHTYRSAWDNLDEVTRRLFLLISLVPPQGGALDYLKTVSELELDDLLHALNLLVTLNLVDVRGGLGERRYTIHNLTRSFLMEQVGKWQK